MQWFKTNFRPVVATLPCSHDRENRGLNPLDSWDHEWLTSNGLGFNKKQTKVGGVEGFDFFYEKTAVITYFFQDKIFCGYPQSLSLSFERKGKPRSMSPKAAKMKPNLKPSWILKDSLGRQLELFR